jgi:hypothetical protein
MSKSPGSANLRCLGIVLLSVAATLALFDAHGG